MAGVGEIGRVLVAGGEHPPPVITIHVPDRDTIHGDPVGRQTAMLGSQPRHDLLARQAELRVRHSYPLLTSQLPILGRPFGRVDRPPCLIAACRSAWQVAHLNGGAAHDNHDEYNETHCGIAPFVSARYAPNTAA